MNKVMIITGGSRGIGAATADLAGKRGYAVCVNYRHNRAAADTVVAAIERAGGRAIAVAADVAVESEVVRLFETVDKTFGAITALVNNAGVLDRQARLEEMDATRLNRIFTTNITGCFLCAREAVRRMSKRHGGKGGAIVNVSSFPDPNGYRRSVAVQAGTALQIRRGQVSPALARSWRSLGQYHSRFDRWRQIYNCEHRLPEKLPPVEYPSIGIMR
jgi:NAD(P)-dependent dehydrogenase (short-subunit alcohol dehydrogenase family)